MRKRRIFFLILMVQQTAFSQIHSSSFIKCGWFDMSTAGTLDWAIYGNGEQSKPADNLPSDFKKSGKGIEKSIKIFGKVYLKNYEGYQRQVWHDGTIYKLGGVIDTANKSSIFGLEATLNPESKFILNFKAPGKGKLQMASFYFASENQGTAIVTQGKSRDTVSFSKSQGAVQVVFEGTQPLQIALQPVINQTLVLKSVAATLSENTIWWIRDNKLAMLYHPIAMKSILEESYQNPAPNYLKMAIDFADKMLKYGKDDYGNIKSPLFSNILTREQHPKTTPCPLFAPSDAKQEELSTTYSKNIKLSARENPFRRFNYNVILNYPQGLGGEGPHKVTLYGCDPFEDRELYLMLSDVSNITGIAKYKQASEKAIDYWFKHTQSENGLYPWGEHMGWDLVYDCPVYLKGPSKFFFEANYHEVRDFVPFLKQLINLPASFPEIKTPLEKYALGIWQAHFWDKTNAYYNRHGDYYGQVDQTGELGAFPAHLAFYMRIWCAAYLHTANPQIKKQLTAYFRTTLNMAISRSKEFGFYPFDLAVDLKGENPGKQVPAQSLRLAHHCVWLAKQLEYELPDVAKSLRDFAKMQLGDQSEKQTLKNVEWAENLDDVDFIQGKKSTFKLPDPNQLKDLSKEVQSDAFADEIIQNIWYAKVTGNTGYLTKADKYARIASAVFINSQSPLPTAFANDNRSKTLYGDTFPSFYFKGAKLMRAFALLGEALMKDKSIKIIQKN